LNLPIPDFLLFGTEEQVFWFIVAFVFSRAFTKQLDQFIQMTDWYGRRGKVGKAAARRLMDAFHHFWIGWAMWLYPDAFATALSFIPNLILNPIEMNLSLSPAVIQWIGSGIFYDDVPDMIRYVRMAKAAYLYVKSALAEILNRRP